MYRKDEIDKGESDKLFMVSYNPTLWPIQGIVYNITNGKAYNLTDLPSGKYINFIIDKQQRKDRTVYNVSDCTVYRPHQFQKYICNILAIIDINNLDYYLINSLHGSLVWMDREELTLYTDKMFDMYDMELGNFTFEMGCISINKYHNRLVHNESLNEKCIYKLYNKLIGTIVNFKLRQYLYINHFNIKLKQLCIDNEDMEFGLVNLSNRDYSWYIETIKEDCELTVKLGSIRQTVSYITNYTFDSNITLDLRVFMVGLGKNDEGYTSKCNSYSYKLGNKITDLSEFKEILQYINSKELYSQITQDIIKSTKKEINTYKKFKEQKLNGSNNKKTKTVDNKTYRLEYVVKSGRLVTGYLVRNLKNNKADYLDKSTIITLAQEGLIQNVEAYKDNNKFSLRGTNGFKISSLPKMINLK